MGYQSDLPKSLQTAFNRHNDNYSVDDLKPEILLTSALISDFLLTTDWSDIELKAINRRELIQLIELKRRLIDTKSKVEMGQAKLEFTKAMAKAVPVADFEKMATDMVQFFSRELDTETFSKLSAYMTSALTMLREQE